MRATKNVSQSLSFGNPLRKLFPRDAKTIHFNRLFAQTHGVVVLVGFGINVRVDRGHLILQDGIGDDRRIGRFPRVRHGLKRLVVIGSDGMISLAAIRWLADQDIAFAMLERDGCVLLSTGPVAASDTRLRRAQACAQHSAVGIEIVRHLLQEKLNGQEALTRQRLVNPIAAGEIRRFSVQLQSLETIDTLRIAEANAAAVYWTAWQVVTVQFPASDLARVPEHWRTFGTRRSPISGTSRRPPNPVNAILNYLYTLLESETRLAISALGLDPGFGLLHVDQSNRDSLVYDLMEPIRSKIDLYVLDWISRTPLKRSWFFEERDGSCRLMSDLTVQLSDTALTWSREVAPYVEWFAQTLVSDSAKASLKAPGTRLTKRRNFEGQGSTVPVVSDAPTQGGVCATCGSAVSARAKHCHTCSLTESGKRLSAASEGGRKAAGTPEVAERKRQKMIEHRRALKAWNPADLPEWLTDEFYLTQIQPQLRNLSGPAVAEALGVHKDFLYPLIRGEKVPHRRHWLKLAEMVNIGW
jgi:CRISPR-associated endonuclease Cas1